MKKVRFNDNSTIPLVHIRGTYTQNNFDFIRTHVFIHIKYMRKVVVRIDEKK